MEDLSHWPLVVGVYREEATLQAYQAQLDSWQAWFAREQPFALLRVYATPGSLAHPEGSAAAGKSWLAQNRPLLQRWVIGMATVILPPQDYARLKNMQVERRSGCPAACSPRWRRRSSGCSGRCSSLPGCRCRSGRRT